MKLVDCDNTSKTATSYCILHTAFISYAAPYALDWEQPKNMQEDNKSLAIIKSQMRLKKWKTGALFYKEARRLFEDPLPAC